ncbi:MAG TPA: 3',5'-cyclic-nucleotide phosphodiesterase [Pyrinomonadaceae bacterium]|nr:3',5'-cyclic-nucleotide phosphodiesterase [Pyrinomonadaceae bacterium]
MKIQLLPSTFDDHGRAASEQRLTCFLINDRITVDAGSIAIALTDAQRETVRDVIVTHPHMDHIASLPIFVDDLFGFLREPIRVYATEEVIDALEKDVFNWMVYPRFSELKNEHGHVMKYIPIRAGEEFEVADLRVTAIPVNHIVPTVGLIISDGKTTVAFSSDTAETEEFWKVLNRTQRIDALMIEASFPNSMSKLAEDSRHFTPASMCKELQKLNNHHQGLDILVVHLKPAYRSTVVEELNALNIPRLQVMEPGRTYEW